MKKDFIILLIFLLFSVSAFSQEKDGHYSISGGMLGVYNIAHFGVGGNNPAGLKYNAKTSGGGGIWFNFPLSKSFSLETQGIFTTYRYEPDFMFGTEFKGSMDYASVPVFLKFQVATALALTGGLQFDFLTSARDVNLFSNKDAFMKTSTSWTTGFELFPRGRFTFFSRYIHGMTDMENRGNPVKPALYNRVFQLGVKLKLFGGYTAPPPVVVPPVPVVVASVDTDGDGIADKDDKCPAQAGIAKYGGCPIPDSDGDGMNDEEDKCPNQKGLAKYGGCPIPDTDGDGINDEEDKCPNKTGLARYNGCPVPDTDGDGVNDEEDRCPNVAGIAENKGCPKIDYQANEVTFASGKSILTVAGKKELNVLVDFLNKNPDVKINLDGYTDNTGTDKVNVPLSEKRAAAAKKYLVTKGIEEGRIASAGHGSANPVADNKTPKGKAKNRRVEVSVQ